MAVTLKPVSFDPFQAQASPQDLQISPEVQVDREKARLALLEKEQSDSPNDPDVRNEIESTKTGIASGDPFGTNRGAQIAQELKRKPVFPLDAPKASVVLKPVQGDPFAAPDTGGVAPSDFVKSGVAGAASGAGMIAQGGGELLARGINKIGDKLGFDPELRAENPLQGWINDLLDNRTPAAKKAEAGTQISGELMKPSTWSAGNDPSLAGLSLQGMNAIGQFAPNLGIALVTAGASVPTQLTIGATVGGIQALGGSLDQEREAIQGMSHEDLMAHFQLYAELVGRGVPREQAKSVVKEAAAIGGGLGNAIPSAAEGAFENFLIGALTRGTLKLPSLGAGFAGRVASGVVGGALTGGPEEAVEQVGQNVGSNIATGGDRPIGDDTLQQFVMGAIAEGTAGGGAGVISKGSQPAAQPSAQPAPQPSATMAQPQAPLGAGAPQESPAKGEQGAPGPAPAPVVSPIDQARVDAQVLKSGGDLPDADEVRLKNATLVSVYGENAAVRHVIEAPEQFGAIGDAMLMAAPTVERVRGTLKAGESRDITNDILGAIDELAQIKEQGGSVAEVLAHGVHHELSYEAQQLAGFLDENAGNPKKIAGFLENYLHEVETATGVPSQVRGRAFDIIEEQRLARKKAEEEFALEEKNKADEKTKAAQSVKASEQKQDQDVEEAVIRGEAAGSGLQPKHETAMEIAFKNAKKLKGKPNAKPSPGSAGRVSATSPENAPANEGKSTAVEVQPEERASPLPEPAATGNARNARPLRQNGGQESTQGLNRGAAIAAEMRTGDGTRENPVIATRPRHIAQAAAIAEEQPSSAQKEAGNYQKGHFKFAEDHPLAGLGLISIETAKGRERVDKKGKWSVTNMPAHYGHLQIAEGADGDKADVTVGDDLNAKSVYVIDQINPDTKKFDETKSMVGFASRKAAEAVYAKSFTDGRGRERLGAITEMTPAQYVARAQSNGLKNAVAYKEGAQSEAPTPVSRIADIPMNLEIRLPVHVEETGETVYVTRNARQAYRDASQRVNRLQSLLDCL